jgi:hypothetical protein
VAGSGRAPQEPPKSSQRADPGHAGEGEQDQPYTGKHRAPEPKFRYRGLARGFVNVALDQPPAAPDTPGETPSEVPGDQQTADGRQ